MNNFAGKLGIVRTRDLVELYFGARFVTSITETEFGGDLSASKRFLAQDARRIGYEIILANPTVAGVTFFLWSNGGIDGPGAIEYSVPPHSTLVVQRSWITDAEAVCLPVFGNGPAAGCQITTRETFLTPPPVDEDLTD